MGMVQAPNRLQWGGPPWRCQQRGKRPGPEPPVGFSRRVSTGGGKAIRLLVHDQIPVSEDERLKVEILQPKGLSVGGGGVGAGAPTRDGKEDRDWGTAVASLKKEGEVSWDVSLKAGRGVRLGLEYVVALPGGEHAVQCQDVGKTWTQMHE
ncbi:hypothetical protein HYQ44_004438 [Verticillium longisporum]|nr:hypothetical protein HYQ44_004438 [Verticillium longisporum]